MRMHFLATTVILGAVLTVCSAAVTQIDLTSYFNTKAASTGPDDTFADFDGSGRAYPMQYLPSDLNFVYQGISFTLPPFHNSSAFDTVRSTSQTITVPSSSNATNFHSLHMLASAVWDANGSSTYQQGNVTFSFEDGSNSTAGFVVGPWWSTNPFDGPIRTPFHYANQSVDNETIDWNVTSIGYVTVRMPSSKALKAITLPTQSSYINIFSLSLLSASSNSTASQPKLAIQNVRATTRWMNDASGNERVQTIEVTVNNLAPLSSPTSSWLTCPHNFSVSSSSLDTVIAGRILRLRNNDQSVVLVGVRNKAGVEVGSTADVAVTISPDPSCAKSAQATLDGAQGWQITAGVPEWTADDASLRTHEAPDWYDSAKFGIFIHWGVYSVPAWAPSGKQYAEWYDWQVHVPPNSSSPTWVHHRDTYGESVVYDDFIANFTADAWNPDDWTDLFVNAGAKYFVITTKHHDGFALFDPGDSSDRNSIKLGPKRNIIHDLFASAKARHPDLHRGTYFSLPEWYNPSYGPYGRGTWPGHPALNAYTGQCCDPYIGYKPVDDFLTGIQRPQMESLFFEHDTEILWCDIGGATAFPSIGADWYNYAASQGRQVVMNNRCGANQSDFVTPEYATFGSPLYQKWESSAGMDPFSYGYNSDTPPQNYQNASSIIVELVDIVSKGGNFLLDIGPTANGSVIPEESGPLLEVGSWLMHSGAAIYNTRPWFIQPADTTPALTDVRFTTSATAFYIIAISRPKDGVLKTSAPVPVKQGDSVRLLGGSGASLAWSVEDALFQVQVGDDELDSIQLSAWAFEIVYETP